MFDIFSSMLFDVYLYLYDIRLFIEIVELLQQEECCCFAFFFSLLVFFLSCVVCDLNFSLWA